MQLGYTIPLQRFLNIRSIPYGASCDLRLCWDLHVLSPNGRPSLFCVHSSSRYALLFYDLSGEEWKSVPGLFTSALRRILPEEGIPATGVERYLSMAGDAQITKTHGRRPVAYLNRAVDDLHSLPLGLDADSREQPQVRAFLNGLPCRAAGHEGTGTAREFMRRDIGALLEKK